MAHPWTTYKVRRVCEACAERRGRLDGRVRKLREELGWVRERMEERGLLGERKSSGDRKSVV